MDLRNELARALYAAKIRIKLSGDERNYQVPMGLPECLECADAILPLIEREKAAAVDAVDGEAVKWESRWHLLKGDYEDAVLDRDEAVARERAAIVAWLRDAVRDATTSGEEDSMLRFADAIERGDHATEAS